MASKSVQGVGVLADSLDGWVVGESFRLRPEGVVHFRIFVEFDRGWVGLVGTNARHPGRLIEELALDVGPEIAGWCRWVSPVIVNCVIARPELFTQIFLCPKPLLLSPELSLEVPLDLLNKLLFDLN